MNDNQLISCILKFILDQFQVIIEKKVPLHSHRWVGTVMFECKRQCNVSNRKLQNVLLLHIPLYLKLAIKNFVGTHGTQA